MVKFRFQDLEIWQMAIDIAEKLFDIADSLCAMLFALCEANDE